jgi:hypothetical protein
MKTTHAYRPTIPVAAVLLACASLMLSGCSGLGETYDTGAGISVRYPTDWNMLHEEEYLYFSPEDIDLLFEGTPLAIFGVDYSIQDPEALAAEPSELIDYWAWGMGLEIDEELETVGRGDIVWHRTPFTLEFPDPGGMTQGWIAVTVLEDKVVFSLALAPTDIWPDYENTFENMLVNIAFE